MKIREERFWSVGWTFSGSSSSCSSWGWSFFSMTFLRLDMTFTQLDILALPHRQRGRGTRCNSLRQFSCFCAASNNSRGTLQKSYKSKGPCKDTNDINWSEDGKFGILWFPDEDVRDVKSSGKLQNWSQFVIRSNSIQFVKPFSPKARTLASLAASRPVVFISETGLSAFVSVSCHRSFSMACKVAARSSEPTAAWEGYVFLDDIIACMHTIINRYQAISNSKLPETCSKTAWYLGVTIVFFVPLWAAPPRWRAKAPAASATLLPVHDDSCGLRTTTEALTKTGSLNWQDRLLNLSIIHLRPTQKDGCYLAKHTGLFRWCFPKWQCQVRSWKMLQRSEVINDWSVGICFKKFPTTIWSKSSMWYWNCLIISIQSFPGLEEMSRASLSIDGRRACQDHSKQSASILRLEGLVGLTWVKP